MPRHEAKDVKKASERAWTIKRQWEPLLRKCFQFALPQRNPYHNGTGNQSNAQQYQGQQKVAANVFDSTAINDVIKLANRIKSDVLADGQEWAEFEPGPFISKDQLDAAKRDLYALQKTLFALLQMSNFDVAISEWLLELVAVGTAVLQVLEGQDPQDAPLTFVAIPQSQVAFRIGPNGDIDGHYREHEMAGRLIEVNWDDAEIPEKLKDQIAKNPEDTIKLCEANYYDYKDRVWYYDVMVIEGADKDAQRIVERQYAQTRFIASRWMRVPGEVQGRSPVMAALPDIQTLNKLKELLLRNASLAVAGAWTIRADGTTNPNNVRIFPGATIGVRSNGGNAGPSIQRLDVGGDVNLAQLIIEDLQNSIHSALMNMGLPADTGAPRSATEWMIRARELQQDLGAPFARILREGIVPILQTTLYLMGELGIIPKFADGALKLNGSKVKVRFTSPLVEAQSLREVEKLANASAMSKQVVGPQVDMLSLKVEDAGAWIYKKFGVDPELIRTSEERKTLEGMGGQLMAQTGAEAQIQPGGGSFAPGGAANQNGVAPQQLAA